MNGNEAKFINHSCNPNCSMKVLKNEGKLLAFIFAVSETKKETE